MLVHSLVGTQHRLRDGACRSRIEPNDPELVQERKPSPRKRDSNTHLHAAMSKGRVANVKLLRCIYPSISITLNVWMFAHPDTFKYRALPHGWIQLGPPPRTRFPPPRSHFTEAAFVVCSCPTKRIGYCGVTAGSLGRLCGHGFLPRRSPCQGGGPDCCLEHRPLGKTNKPVNHPFGIQWNH